MNSKKLKVMAVGLAVVIGLTFLGLAQAADKPAPAKKDLKAMQEQLEKMREEMEQRQAQMLERIKQTNPEEYNRLVARQERQQQISAILQDFRQKKIDAASAESQLSPLVKAEVDDELLRIDQRISRAEAAIKELKNIQAQPEIRIKQKLDRLLGKAKPGADFIGGF
ncbi:MAG: hypothetical protein ACOY3D_08850 [Candidatus Omnitrophota bacterium]